MDAIKLTANEVAVDNISFSENWIDCIKMHVLIWPINLYTNLAKKKVSKNKTRNNLF